MAHHHLADDRREATLSNQAVARLRSMDTQGGRSTIFSSVDPRSFTIVSSTSSNRSSALASAATSRSTSSARTRTRFADGRWH
jgi:hypothetical protein